MLSSTRFIVAIHALSVIATHAAKGPVCSALVAASVNTNPVVIRRLMRSLELAGLVTSAPGRAGGFSLKRPAARISLYDIYKAVEGDGIFRMHKIDPESKCPIGAVVAKFLTKPLRTAEEALEKSLADTSLRDIAAHIA
ncbi:Rrf2 family transcriptional regulator [soil metagenome]